MPNPINDTDFGMLPKSDTMVAYKDRIVLYDNLDRSLSSVFNDEINAFITLFPKRIDFTVVVVCVEGEIEVGCNLRTLKAGPGGLIVLVPGTIGESIRIAPDTHLIVLAVPDKDYAPDSSFQNATYSQKNFTAPICLHLDDEVLKSGIESYRQLKHTILTMGDQLTDDLVKAYIMVLAGLAAVNLQKWMISNPENKIPPKELLLKKFLYKPVKGVLESRTSEIDGAFDEAKRANDEAQAAKEQYESDENGGKLSAEDFADFSDKYQV